MIEGGNLHSGPTPRGEGVSAAATTKATAEVSQVQAENALILTLDSGAVASDGRESIKLRTGQAGRFAWRRMPSRVYNPELL